MVDVATLPRVCTYVHEKSKEAWQTGKDSTRHVASEGDREGITDDTPLDSSWGCNRPYSQRIVIE